MPRYQFHWTLRSAWDCMVDAPTLEEAREQAQDLYDQEPPETAEFLDGDLTLITDPDTGLEIRS